MVFLLQIVFWTLLWAPAEKVSLPGKDHSIELHFYDTDGKPRKLSEFRGKVVHLMVWASYCKGCKEVHDVVREAENKIGDDIVWLFISVDKEESLWRHALETKAAPGHHMVVKGEQLDELKDVLDLKGIPVNFWIEPTGEISYSNAPMPEGAWLKQLEKTAERANERYREKASKQ